MRFLVDHSLDRGRVVIRRDDTIIAVAPTVEALAIVSYALVVGEELRADPATMPHVLAWIARMQSGGRHREAACERRDRAGARRRRQAGEVLLCRLSELQYVPGADSETEMIVGRPRGGQGDVVRG